jgi:hypothetical protein
MSSSAINRFNGYVSALGAVYSLFLLCVMLLGAALNGKPLPQQSGVVALWLMAGVVFFGFAAVAFSWIANQPAATITIRESL